MPHSSFLKALFGGHPVGDADDLLLQHSGLRYASGSQLLLVQQDVPRPDEILQKGQEAQEGVNII